MAVGNTFSCSLHTIVVRLLLRVLLHLETPDSLGLLSLSSHVAYSTTMWQMEIVLPVNDNIRVNQ